MQQYPNAACTVFHLRLPHGALPFAVVRSTGHRFFFGLLPAHFQRIFNLIAARFQFILGIARTAARRPIIPRRGHMRVWYNRTFSSIYNAMSIEGVYCVMNPAGNSAVDT